MRIVIKPLVIAAALAFAGAAHAQDHDALEYRLLAANSNSATIVSTNVSGPQNARRLTNIMMARIAITSPSQNGMKAGPGPPEPHH